MSRCENSLSLSQGWKKKEKERQDSCLDTKPTAHALTFLLFGFASKPLKQNSLGFLVPTYCISKAESREMDKILWKNFQ